MYKKFNSNIRCIEIIPMLAQGGYVKGLIVTLDVLKYILKIYFCLSKKFNSNIRCIEIISM